MSLGHNARWKRSSSSQYDAIFLSFHLKRQILKRHTRVSSSMPQTLHRWELQTGNLSWTHGHCPCKFSLLGGKMNLWTYPIGCKLPFCCHSKLFSKNRPSGQFFLVVAMSVYISIYISVCLSVPFPCYFFKASRWPSDHMISSRPLIWSTLLYYQT